MKKTHVYQILNKPDDVIYWLDIMNAQSMGQIQEIRIIRGQHNKLLIEVEIL